MEFGIKLRRLREIYGYSQEYVADYCGITQSAYSKKEKGLRIPSYERLQQLSTLYKIEIDKIVSLPTNSLLIIALKKQIEYLEEIQKK